MNTLFKIDGNYELEITSDGTLPHRNVAFACASRKDCVGVSLHYSSLLPQIGDEPRSETKASFFLKRNQARAIASAILNAVSEAA